jgi:site-specific DNA-methyltransferase (adenine-specific)
LSIKNEVYCVDNMEYMSTVPDKFFDLAPVDPEYGININNNMGRRKNEKSSNYKKVKWDNSIPSKEYFNELFRISRYQIIWGGNYFTKYLSPNNNWIVWHKMNDGVTFSMCELAWTNFYDKNIKLFKLYNNGIPGRIHPTQKPIALYKWLLKNYAQPGWKIFDSHVGSGSSRIACYDMGFDFIGCENDHDYWQAQEDRFKNHISQTNLFSQDEMQDLIFQGSL